MGPVPAEVKVIEDKEAKWDNSKRKDDLEGKRYPYSKIKRALSQKKKVHSDLSDCAEDFCLGLNIYKEEYQKQVQERLCLHCDLKGYNVGDYKVKTLLDLEKADRVKFA